MTVKILYIVSEKSFLPEFIFILHPIICHRFFIFINRYWKVFEKKNRNSLVHCPSDSNCFYYNATLRRKPLFLYSLWIWKSRFKENSSCIYIYILYTFRRQRPTTTKKRLLFVDQNDRLYCRYSAVENNNNKGDDKGHRPSVDVYRDENTPIPSRDVSKRPLFEIDSVPAFENTPFPVNGGAFCRTKSVTGRSRYAR